MKASEIYKRIYSFVDSCRKVYCYGNGHYGKAMINLLEHGGKKIDGVLVSDCSLNEKEMLSFSSVENNLDYHDGIIFAMSQRNVASLDKRIRSVSQCLFLKDWELDEVCKFDYYQVVGDTADVNFFKYSYCRFLNYFFRWLRRLTIRNKNIEPWHLISKREKPYCDEIIRYILGIRTEGMIAELGCGLCDIIGDKRLKGFERIGLDIDEAVIDARLHHNDVVLKVGSFESIGKDGNIHFLITLNFLHAISPRELRSKLEYVLSKNKVDYYIADEVTGNYKYLFKLEDVLPDGYVLDKVIGIHPSDGGVRIVKAFYKR